jgi:hypothetical protein
VKFRNYCAIPKEVHRNNKMVGIDVFRTVVNRNRPRELRWRIQEEEY